jgi:N-acetylmuramoyl-L-alanine amidase/peptidoglycan L-alanyl-D-glutamate endopeptidase CwlK
MNQILGRGATGAEVERLQNDLNRLGYSVRVDGLFSEATEAAVMEFQRQHSLTADGVVGPQTGRALGAALG